MKHSPHSTFWIALSLILVVRLALFPFIKRKYICIIKFLISTKLTAIARVFKAHYGCCYVVHRNRTITDTFEVYAGKPLTHTGGQSLGEELRNMSLNIFLEFSF